MKEKDQKDTKKEQKSIVVVPSAEFDLNTYISRYEGNTKIARLLFIAERFPEKQVEATKMAVDALKLTKNTTLYKKVFEKVGDKLGTGYTYDSQWADGTDKKAQATNDELEAALNNYKTNLIRKKIRTGHNALGDFHYERGDFSSALRSYIRTQDYCTSNDHIIELCLNVIRVSIAMNNFAHIPNYVEKAETTPDVTDKTVFAQLNASYGLAHIENKKYKQAALKFISVAADVSHKFPDIVSPQDVAIYGGLCALAEFDRKELKEKVLDNANFKIYLELLPKLGAMISDFYNSKYASCLAYLDVLKNDLQLDLHLHDHITNLYEKIRSKALVQYFSPYTSVDLNKMAQAFQVSVEDLEKELAKLIMEGERGGERGSSDRVFISARIDSHNKRLYARQTQERRATFDRAIGVGEDFQINTRAMLVRVNLIRNNMIVKPTKFDEGPAGAGAGQRTGEKGKEGKGKRK